MARGPLAGPAGPGKFSTRTDGLSFQPDTYGAGVEQAAIKSGAPLAKTPDVRGARAGDVRAAAQGAAVTPLYAPTQRPDEPITTGISLGAGAGPEIMGMQAKEDADYVNAYQLFQQLAANPTASPSIRYLAERIQQGF
jgi:hypothetical protein